MHEVAERHFDTAITMKLSYNTTQLTSCIFLGYMCNQNCNIRWKTYKILLVLWPHITAIIIITKQECTWYLYACLTKRWLYGVMLHTKNNIRKWDPGRRNELQMWITKHKKFLFLAPHCHHPFWLGIVRKLVQSALWQIWTVLSLFLFLFSALLPSLTPLPLLIFMQYWCTHSEASVLG